MVMNDSHRRFIQVLMSHGIMEASAVRKLHRHCCEIHKVHYVHDKLDDFIDVINKHLKPVFMEIRKRFGEDDGKRYYALVNTVENDVAKMATDYAENELELFRRALDLIIESTNGFASSTYILNLADNLQNKKMRKKEAEQLLQRFVQDKWLIERDGEYTLHTRCLMEMEHYMRNNYPDLMKICNICRDITIQSQACVVCGIYIHLPCVEKYFKGHAEPSCPQCSEPWAHEIPDLNQADSQSSPIPSTSKNGPVHTQERRLHKTQSNLRSRR
ncbi:non-structural maintenance of chromosomes element 1 homolog [Pelobates fuscus]|uniref:non-structural maintenance of chromosomes element 1 homolog n=1 Tax=Pelobates fuscus TaxID=191477 RepID=UPI002FE4E5E1